MDPEDSSRGRKLYFYSVGIDREYCHFCDHAVSGQQTPYTTADIFCEDPWSANRFFAGLGYWQSHQWCCGGCDGYRVIGNTGILDRFHHCRHTNGRGACSPGFSMHGHPTGSGAGDPAHDHLDVLPGQHWLGYLPRGMDLVADGDR